MASRTLEFFEPRVRFGMQRPAGWHFARPDWMPCRDRLPLSQIDWSVHGRTPFLSLVRDTSTASRPWPTLRVCCRPIDAWSSSQVRRALEQARAACGEPDGASVLACSFDTMIGGHRTAHVRLRYELPVRVGGRVERWRVLARSDLVLTPGLAFAIGAVSSAEERGFDEEAFREALASVRIGRVDELLPSTRGGRVARGQRENA